MNNKKKEKKRISRWLLYPTLTLFIGFLLIFLLDPFLPDGNYIEVGSNIAKIAFFAFIIGLWLDSKDKKKENEKTNGT